MLIERLSGLKKRRGFAPKLFAPCPQGFEPLLRRRRFLFAHADESGFQNAFMTNLADAPELVAGPSQMHLLEQGVRSLSAMMRGFKGRTWQGFHHHLALAAMAHYVSSARHRSRNRVPAK